MKNLIFAIATLLAGSSIGQVISTEAPSVSASSVTVPKGTFQVESSIGLMRTPFAPIRISLPYNLFRVGLTERLELRASNEFYLNTLNGTTTGLFGPLELGLKYQFVKDANKPNQFGIIGHVEIPKPETSFRRGYVNFAASHQIATKHTIGYNAGLTLTSIEVADEKQLSQFVNYSLIYNFAVNSKFIIFAEIFGNYMNEYFQATDNDTSIDFGAMYLLRDNIQIDYVYGRGIDEDFDFHSIGFNVLIPSVYRRRPGGRPFI